LNCKSKKNQQAAAGHGGGHGRRGKPRYYPRLGETKEFKSTIPEITHNTFNTEQNKFATQFTQLQKNVANYLQHGGQDVLILSGKLIRIVPETSSF
jgi:hypothetical protein